MFESIFNATESLDVMAFLIVIAVSLLLGIIVSITHMYKTKTTSSFAMTLALLPAIVSIIIVMVNGNIGTGIAVAGAFSLVRFRSIAGNAKEILSVFFAMAIGLITGMGYILYAVIFTLIIAGTLLALNAFNFGKTKAPKTKLLRVTIPESLDYSGIFDDIFEKYTKEHVLNSVKTTNMGSLFRLTYEITLKDDASEKEMIDKIRVKNGNLEIGISIKEPDIQTEL